MNLDETFFEELTSLEGAKDLVLVGKKHEYSDVYSFEFKKTEELSFVPGQYADFHMPDFDTNKGKGVRIFSLANTADENILLAMHTRSGSEFKKRMSELVEGDKITISNIRGNFVLPEDSDDGEVVFIAGGIGITPIRSMLLTKNSADHTLMHVSQGEYLFEEDLKEKNFGDVKTSYSEIDRELRKLVSEKKGAMFYIAGAPKFVRRIKTSLISLDVPMTNFRQDSFDGYDGM